MVELGREVLGSAVFEDVWGAEACTGATSFASFAGPGVTAVVAAVELVETSTAVKSMVSSGPESRTMQAGFFDRASAGGGGPAF